MNGSVSVIIPAWNAARTLKAAVESALAQTEPPLEVLVCDDGSTDGSEPLVMQIADPRVVWLPGLHSGGPGAPRNRGIAASRGEWIAVLDSDDEWLPEKLDKQRQAAARLNCLASSTNAYSVRPNTVTHPLYLGWSAPEIMFRDLLYDNPVVCSSALFHRSLRDKVGGFSEVHALRSVADYTLWLRIATFTSFAYVDEPLVKYWNDPDSSLRSQDDDPWTQKFLVFADYLRWADESAFPEAKAAAVPLRVRLRRLTWEYRRRKLRILAGTWKQRVLKP